MDCFQMDETAGRPQIELYMWGGRINMRFNRQKELFNCLLPVFQSQIVIQRPANKEQHQEQRAGAFAVAGIFFRDFYGLVLRL